MLKYFLFLVSLFSIFPSKYISLSHKDFDLDIENICFYLNHNDDYDKNTYVKPCEANYYCRTFNKDGQTIGTCEKYTPVVKRFNEDCTSTLDCDTGLICENTKCTTTINGSPYLVNNLYYCSNSLIPIDNSGYICLSTEEEMNGYCYILKEQSGTTTTKRAFPEYFKICGKQDVEKIANTQIYEVKSTTSNYIGSIADNNFVEDIRACKSGYALLFYGDKSINVPEGESVYNMFKKCVTINEVEKYNSNCYINYTIGENTNSYIYNLKLITGSINSLPDECEFIMTKIKLFKEYLEIMEKMKEECENVRFYSEPFTCGNDELRKLWYYYNNVENYLMYKNEEDILNYLIQVEYPLYGFETNNSKNKDSYLYLNINYFILLLFIF